MSNIPIADIIVFVIVAVMAFWGLRSGFIRAVFHLGYYVISVIAALVFYPLVSKFLINSALSRYIHDKVILPRISMETGGLNLPTFLQNAVTEGINNTTEAVAASMTEMAISIICFIIVFILVRFGLKFAVKILDTIAKLPLLNLFNKVGGLAVGVLNGVIIVYLVLALTTFLANDKVYQMINDSSIAVNMYNNNILLKLIFG